MEASLLENFLSSGTFDMILGMVAGMIASPLMMKGIKILRQRRKMNRLLDEIATAHENRGIEGVN